jgi:hypothetical protein
MEFLPVRICTAAACRREATGTHDANQDQLFSLFSRPPMASGCNFIEAETYGTSLFFGQL